MPAKSAAQYRLMQAVAHGAKLRGLTGSPSEAVAKEFIAKTPPKKRALFARK